MRYLLDTYAWLWAVNRNGRLPERVKVLLKETPLTDFALADISVLEVARKAATGQLAIAGDVLVWLRTNSQAVHVLTDFSGNRLSIYATGLGAQGPG